MPKDVRKSAKRWCFTLNNPGEDESRFKNFVQDQDERARSIVYAIYGREHFVMDGGPAPDQMGGGGTPHLQGYIVFEARKRLTQLKKIPGLERAHWEVSKGSVADNIRYCSKEDPSPFIFGEPPSETHEAGGDATASKYATALELARAGDLDSIDPGILVRCHRSLVAIRDDARWSRARALIRPPSIDLTPWQQDLEDIIWRKPDDRKILCYIDPIGGAGKSTFCDWLYANYGYGRTCLRVRTDPDLVPPTVQVLHPSRGVDMAFLLEPVSVFILDCPRAAADHLPWACIEEIKNGYCTSTKYQCVSKRFPRPHVILFMNQPIPEGTFSNDRMEVTWLSRI